MSDGYGDPGIEWAEANAANDDGEAVMAAERAAGKADAAGLCEQHGQALPCARCEDLRESCMRFAQGRSGVAGLLAERTQAAQAAVTVIARHIALEAREDRHELGAAALADAAAEAEAAATALRRLRHITDLLAAKTAMDLADAQEETEVARLRARCAVLELLLAESGADRA